MKPLSAPAPMKFNEESLFELNVDQIQGCYGYSAALRITTSMAYLPPYALGDDGTENSSNSLGMAVMTDCMTRMWYAMASTWALLRLSKSISITANRRRILIRKGDGSCVQTKVNRCEDECTVDPRLYVSNAAPW